ncbi:MAG: amino acid ABC transporter permease, partial [Proteobacteria bacterium]|nr:amino acid ABC transporter permease [Pseudomonadota bacterium]
MSETVKALLKGKLNTAITLSLLVLFVWMASVLLPWGLFNAVFAVDLNACREARGQGACWGVVGEKWKLIIFGRYPFEEAWRPVVASLLMVAACIAICQRQLWRPSTFIAAALVLVGSVAL